ncbi:hypothetical protein [Methanoregula sp.]|jgi:uncharacterized membrane protein|uniref:hypothetical protein n=1 Tax=Methanoregula sp. TaxID=2052170 RepID=UPI003C24CCB9
MVEINQDAGLKAAIVGFCLVFAGGLIVIICQSYQVLQEFNSIGYGIIVIGLGAIAVGLVALGIHYSGQID